MTKRAARCVIDCVLYEPSGAWVATRHRQGDGHYLGGPNAHARAMLEAHRRSDEYAARGYRVPVVVSSAASEVTP